jgi:6-phosphogluconolactonase
MAASPPELHLVDDPSSAIGDLLAEQALRGGSIVLTGGSSVERAYRRAADRTPDWSNVAVWWGDERCVPPDDKLSNYRLAKESLLDRLEAGPREQHRIRGELDPAAAAA